MAHSPAHFQGRQKPTMGAIPAETRKSSAGKIDTSQALAAQQKPWEQRGSRFWDNPIWGTSFSPIPLSECKIM